MSSTRRSGKGIESNMLNTVFYDIADFPLQCRQCVLKSMEGKESPWHWHSELEFLYVKEGEVVFFVNNSVTVLKEGTGIFINTKESHKFRLSKGSGHIKSILFPAAFIFGKNNRFYRDYIAAIEGNSRYQYIILEPDCVWHAAIVEEMRSIWQCYDAGLFSHIVPVIRSVCTIWELLYVNRDKIAATDPGKIMSPSQIRLQQMLAFIQHHYSEPITLADIAKAANISQSEAARCFKKNLGTAPVNYLIQYRLEIAKERLQTSEVSVTDIAMQCGFESVSYFDRVFRKKYWLTPKEFRNNMDYLDR